MINKNNNNDNNNSNDNNNNNNNWCSRNSQQKIPSAVSKESRTWRKYTAQKACLLGTATIIRKVMERSPGTRKWTGWKNKKTVRTDNNDNDDDNNKK